MFLTGKEAGGSASETGTRCQEGDTDCFLGWGRSYSELIKKRKKKRKTPAKCKTWHVQKEQEHPGDRLSTQTPFKRENERNINQSLESWGQNSEIMFASKLCSLHFGLLDVRKRPQLLLWALRKAVG